MQGFIALSPEAKRLLIDIIEHEGESGYWDRRFKGLSRKEDTNLRGCFKELKEKNMIEMLWASNVPYHIRVLKDGYYYEEQMKQNEKEKSSRFENELNELLDRFKEINQTITEIEDPLREKRIWINDVKIFCTKYLTDHILGEQIKTIIFQQSVHRLADTLDNLEASLISIRNDSDFIVKMRNLENKPMESKMLISPLKYDVFISHANKDKEEFVEELNASLEKLGINIFYDKKALEWGDNWKQRIIEGTQKAEFAIIVISENFFDREWTEKELNEFLNRQNSNGQKLILPILHNITIAQLQEKYPSVADIQGISTKDYTCDQIALLFAKQLFKRLRLAHIQ